MSFNLIGKTRESNKKELQLKYDYYHLLAINYFILFFYL